MHFCRRIMLFLALVWGVQAYAQDEDKYAKVEIKTEQINASLYVLFGEGGNIGVSVGEDGVFIIDDQFAPLTPKIKAAVKALSVEPIKYVINTHWHFDHTGGNENLGKEGAIIVAHDNVHKRMSQANVIAPFGWEVKASPKVALPVITFNDRLTFHLNGDEVHITHHKNAHTDGDGIVHFTQANVIHMGDTWFNGFYPFIDVSSGGSIEGMIAAAEYVISTANDKTVIIPGHGPVSNKSALKKYLKMLKTLRSRVQALIDQGKTVEQIIAAKPNAVDYDKTQAGGFINADNILLLIHTSLTK